MKIILFILIFNLTSCCSGDSLRGRPWSGTPVLLFLASPGQNFPFIFSLLFVFYFSPEVAVTVRVAAHLQLQTSLVAVGSGLVPLAHWCSSAGLAGAVGLRSLGFSVPLVTLTHCTTLRQSLTQVLTFCTTHLPQFISRPRPEPWPKPCPILKTHW